MLLSLTVDVHELGDWTIKRQHGAGSPSSALLTNMSSRLQAIGLLLALAVTIWQGQVWGQVYMRVVASDEEFREALRVAAQGSLDTVVLSSSVSVLRLNQSAWTNVSFSIPNSLTIAGQYNGDSRQILDLAFLSNKLSLGPGAVFTFANLVVYGGLTRAG